MNRRAVSSLVGATFFVVLFILGFNLVVYQLAQYDLYTRELLNRNQLERERLSETLTIVDFKTAQNAINLTVANTGGVPVRIVRIWVTNQSSSNPIWHQSFNVQYLLDPGNTTKNIGNNLGTFSSSQIFVARLITERGNSFAALFTIPFASAVTAQGFGWITMDWNSYVYARSGDPNTLLPGWCVKRVVGDKYQFQVKVVNHWDRDVKLLRWSHYKLVATNGATKSFYIMDSSSAANNLVAYGTKITVFSNPTDQATGGAEVTFKFAATAAGGTTGQDVGSADDSFAAFLVVFYEWGAGGNANTLAQTIPVEASEVTSTGTCA